MTNNNKQQKTCVIYLRTATQQKNKPTSMANQSKRCHVYARQENLKVLACYEDHISSGTTLKRKGLQRMLNEIKKIKPNYLLLTDIDRLSRNTTNYFVIKNQLNESGVQILSLNQPDLASNSLIEGVYMSMVTYMSAIQSKRIKKALLAKRHGK
jgi:DNA invertase Pin-like site-specific DNA recombinase